jgi:hypothetical protein
VVDHFEEFRGANGYVAEEEVAVAGHGFSIGSDGEVGSEGEGLLAERGGGGVVDGEQSSGGVGGLGDRGDVGDLHAGVRRGLEPDESGSVEEAGLVHLAGRGVAKVDAHAGEVAFEQQASGEVGVGGQDA